ncbi:MAG: hypothetical protein [Podoviridae sp. ctQNx1]|nr:MAG: hypothetical protein [Podoviridae sp. ctQNx1]UOF78151.1 hypothetical protein [Caudoviricetes sp.]
MSHELSKKLFDAGDRLHALSQLPFVTIEPQELLILSRLFTYGAAEVKRMEDIRIANAKKNRGD